MRHHARCLLLLLSLPVYRASGQEWQPGGELPLLQRAVDARVRRDADTALAGWRAMAAGMVRFSAEVDHGKGPIERVIRADELRVEVYGEAPNRSKQVIRAWRDTTFQVTGIVYHRDHLGIIANDFGSTIRLGEGEEVRDVPHPLSRDGLAAYHYRLGDTLVVSAPAGTVRVVQVEVRPVDPSRPGIVGSLLIDNDRAALVRLDFTFTAASYRDPTVAAISVGLENALHESQHWLPSRQSITIRRAAPVVVLPLATVIRADWVIDDYQLGLQHPPALFRGFAIDGLRQPRSDGWNAAWASPPDALSGWGELHAAIAARASASVPPAQLQGLPRLRVLAQAGVSQLLHINRVQGVAPGFGVRWRAPFALTLDLTAGLGTSDRRFTGGAVVSRSLGDLRVSVTGARHVRDMHEWPRRSLLANSIATLVDGSDAGDWYLSERVEVGIDWTPSPGTTVAASHRWEDVQALQADFTALSGDRLPNPDLGVGRTAVSRLGVSSWRPEGRGWDLTTEWSAGPGDSGWLRVAIQAVGTLPVGMEWRLLGGIASAKVPPHRGFAAGGAGSLPGTVSRAIGGRHLVVAEVARPFPVKLPSPFGRRLAANALKSRLTPFVAAGVARHRLSGLPWPATGAVVPVLGARLDLWGPALRLEAGWAPRSGAFTLMLDAHPDWWPLL